MCHVFYCVWSGREMPYSHIDIKLMFYLLSATHVTHACVYVMDMPFVVLRLYKDYTHYRLLDNGWV